MSLTRICLAIIIAVYILLAGGYSSVTPAATADQHNADENGHMVYIQTLAAHKLPVFDAQRDHYEAHQPPLYYALCLPVYLAAAHSGDAAATRAVRCVSMILGVLLILVTYKSIRLLFPHDPAIPLMAALFVALLPGYVSLAASVTNDALSNLVVAVALWKLLSIVTRLDKECSRLPKAMLLGLALGLGIWTKTTTMVMFPVVVVAFALLAFMKLMPPRAAMRLATVSIGIGIVIGLPWLIRNQLLYGDPIGQRMFTEIFRQTTATADKMIQGPGALPIYLQMVANWTFASFWGVFDSMRLFWGQDPHGRTPSPLAPLDPTYVLIQTACVINLVGVLAFARTRWNGASPEKKTAAWTMAALAAVTGVVFVRFILTFFQAQGRYLYPALVPVAACTAIGLRGLIPNRVLFIGAACAVAAVLLALNLYSLFGLIGPRFAAP